MLTFIAMLFILLFTLSYNEKKNEDFFTEMRLTFGAKDIEQDKVITTEALFVSRVEGFIKKEKLQEHARVLVDEQKIKLILSPPVLFDSGKAVLKKRGQEILKSVAEVFSTVENPIIVEGHTDNVPIHTKKFESNWELSFHRSFSVLKYFFANFNFSPRQFSAIGYGEFHPLVANDTPENRAINRRIEINVIRITEAAAFAPHF
ncbi:MAG: OmpA family protein [bacterium]|nr:OmpA family protein [bacterium]